MDQEVSRCYKVGSNVQKIRATVDCAMLAKDSSDLKIALYTMKTAAKEAARDIPQAKDVANAISTRSRKLGELAEDLAYNTQKHERFFHEQLLDLRGYAQELENRSLSSCLGFGFPAHTLEKLKPIPKDIEKAASKARAASAKRLRARQEKWAREVAAMRRRLEKSKKTRK